MAKATLIVRIRVKGNKAARAALDALAKALGRVKKAARGASVALGPVGAAIRKSGSSAKTAGGLLGAFRGKLLDAFLISGVVSIFVAQINRVVEAFFNLVNETTRVNIALTAADIKLRASTSGTDEYAEANARLGRIVERLGLELLTSKESLAEFLAATRQSNLVLDERISIFESLAQAGRVFNLSSERIKLAFLAVTQIASKGAASMEEVRRQLGDQIPGVVPLLAKALGITVSELFDRIRRKALSAEDALRALKTGLDELVGDQVFEASRLLIADLGRLQTELVKTKERFAEVSEEGVQGFVQAITQLLKDTEGLQQRLGGEAGGILGIFKGATEELGDLALSVKFIEEEFGVSLPVAFALAQSASSDFTQVLRDANAASKETFADLPETVEDAAARFIKFAADVASGQLKITKGFEALGKGANDAAGRILEIAAAVEKGTLSIGEAEAEIKTLIITIEQSTQAQLERVTRSVVDSVAAIEAARRKAAEASSGAAEEAKREQERLSAETIAGAQRTAAERVRIELAARREITESEQALLDEKLRLFDAGLEGVTISSGKRQEIEQELLEGILKIEDAFQLKRTKLVEDAAEKLKKDNANREKIEKDLAAALFKIDLKRQQDFEKLLDKKDEAVRRSSEREIKEAKRVADKVIKEAERAAKRRLQLLNDQIQAQRSFGDEIAALLAEEQGGTVTIGGDSSGATEAAGRLAAAQKELLEIQKKVVISLAESNRQFELTSQIIPGLRAELAGIGTSAAAGTADLIGFGNKLLELFRKNTIGSSAFSDELRRLGPVAESQFTSIIEEMARVAEAGNLNVQRLEEFRLATEFVLTQAGSNFSVLDERITQTGSALDAFNAKAAEVAVGGVADLGGTAETAGAEVQMLAGAGEEGATSITNLAGAADEADVQVTGLGEDAKEARIKITNMGADAEAAGGGVQILERESAAAAGSVGKLADEAERVSQAAEVPEDAIESIRTLGQVSSETAPLVEPLVSPLEAISAAVASLAEAVPLLPEPLASIVESIVRLVEEKILEKAGVDFKALSEAAKPLSEDLPVVALELKSFVDTAATSEEPLNTLHGGLTRISAEDLVARLLSTADSLVRIRTELEALASDSGGFSQAAAKAESFKTTIDELQTAMDEFISFLARDFARALLDHATDWNGPIDAATVYKTTIEEISETTLPAFAEAGESAMQRVDSAAFKALQTVNQLNLALKEALDLSEQLDR